MTLDFQCRDYVRKFAEQTAGETILGFLNWFERLPAEAWLIELARSHVRLLLSPQQWRHARFAQWLRLKNTREYRLILRRPSPDRADLVELARRLLRLNDPEWFEGIKKSSEYVRFAKTRAAWQRRSARRVGRKVEAMIVPGPMGEYLERTRVEAALSVESWAKRLGIAAMTYRNWLERDDKKLAPLCQRAKDAAFGLERAALDRQRRGRAVTAEELDRAYELVWRDLTAFRSRIGKGKYDILRVEELS